MDDLPTFLQGLPALGFGFMLVVIRVGSALLTWPALGENDIPATVRIALAVMVSALVYPLLQSHLPAVPDAVTALVGLIALEFAVGVLFGFMARVLVMALAMAGGIVSFMIGLSSVLQIDPSLGTQVPALQRLMGMAAVALLFSSGLYVLPLQAVLGSYDVIPADASFDAGGAAQLVTGAISESFGLALRLASPFIVTGIVWQAAMGFVSRLVPNIQVHLVSAPAQIVGGLALMTAGILSLFATWSAGMTRSLSLLPGL